jgi:NTP pyrophosphatase (non-canonical NTP hydrolase)
VGTDAEWSDVQRRLDRFRDERDWQQFHALKELAAAIAIEAGELQELFLWKSTAEEAELLQNNREAIEDELADVMIQCLNFVSSSGIDAINAINRKIDKNEQRYPADAVRGRAEKAPQE